MGREGDTRHPNKGRASVCPSRSPDPQIGCQQLACRWRPIGTRMVLEAWSKPLVVGSPLPVLPLWLSEELAVPLDLEASYEQACRDLRIV